MKTKASESMVKIIRQLMALPPSAFEVNARGKREVRKALREMKEFNAWLCGRKKRLLNAERLHPTNLSENRPAKT